MRTKRFLVGARGICVPVFGASPQLFRKLQIEFAAAPTATQRTAPPIVVFNKPNRRHFGYNWTAGHCHDNQRICIRSRYYYPGLLRHEMTHAHLSTQPLWFEEWSDIAGNVYLGDHWNEQSRTVADLLADGLLDSYAAKNPGEDVAKLVEAVHRFTRNLIHHEMGVLDPFPNASDGLNVVIAKKVQQLRQLGLITAEEYRTVIVRLTSYTMYKFTPASPPTA